MFTKSTAAELELQIIKLKKRLLVREQQLAQARNQIAMLITNAKRWSQKFKNPLYSVPTKIIAQMERETEEYKQRARAKLDEYAAKNAILMEKVIELKGKQLEDSFGDNAGNEDMEFSFSTSHTNSHIKPEDRVEVDLELDKRMQQRLFRHSQKN